MPMVRHNAKAASSKRRPASESRPYNGYWAWHCCGERRYAILSLRYRLV